jgi:hypothetical protein
VADPKAVVVVAGAAEVAAAGDERLGTQEKMQS